MNSRRKSAFWLFTGLIACPCHLALTLPLILGLTAGTALGVALANNAWIIAAISTAYFVGALVLGFRSLRANKAACRLSVSRSNLLGTDSAEFACCLLDDSRLDVPLRG